jgi:hypothetical protein
VSNKLIEHTHYYFNEEGLMVFTSAYHLERGYCCGNGCMHCPYNFEAVPEPHKTHLLQERKENNLTKDSTE